MTSDCYVFSSADDMKIHFDDPLFTHKHTSIAAMFIEKWQNGTKYVDFFVL